MTDEELDDAIASRNTVYSPGRNTANLLLQGIIRYRVLRRIGGTGAYRVRIVPVGKTTDVNRGDLYATLGKAVDSPLTKHLLDMTSTPDRNIQELISRYSARELLSESTDQ